MRGSRCLSKQGSWFPEHGSRDGTTMVPVAKGQQPQDLVRKKGEPQRELMQGILNCLAPRKESMLQRKVVETQSQLNNW